VKKTLCAIAIAASLFTVSALAQNTRTKGVPALVKSQGPIRGHYKAQPSEVPPAVCSPTCLTYTGDTNPASPDDNGFANENTLLVSDTTGWGAFTVPAGQTWTVDGAFINTIERLFCVRRSKILVEASPCMRRRSASPQPQSRRKERIHAMRSARAAKVP